MQNPKLTQTHFTTRGIIAELQMRNTLSTTPINKERKGTIGSIWTGLNKEGRAERWRTCFSMLRSSSWSLALLPRRDDNITGGLDGNLCPENQEPEQQVFAGKISGRRDPKNRKTQFKFKKWPLPSESMSFAGTIRKRTGFKLGNET